MTQTTDPNPADPNLPPNAQPTEPTPPPGTLPPPPAKKKKKRRLWLKIPLALLLILILLVVFLPQIAGMGFVRSLVVSRVNDNLNGKLQIADWHIGWTGGVVVQGVKVFDDQGTVILDVPRMSTQLSLINAIKGNYDLGKTSVEGPAKFLLIVDENGKTNFAKIAKTAPTETAEDPEKKKGKHATTKPASKLPEVKGQLAIDATGEVRQAGKPPVFVDVMKANATITSINDPVSEDALLTVRVGERGKPGTVKLAGTVDAVDNNVLLTESLNQIKADQTLQLVDLDAASASPFLGGDTQLGGIINGQLALKNGGAGTGAKGQLTIANALVGGAALKGDTFKTSAINIPIDVSRSGDGASAALKISKLAVEIPDQEVNVNVTGAIPETALNNIGAKQAPGAEGNVVATISAGNLKKLADQLPHMLGLPQGTSVDGGKFTNTATLSIGREALSVTQRTELVDLKSTTNGQQIAAQPLVVTADAALPPTLDGLKTAAVKLITGNEAAPLVNLTLAANDVATKSVADATAPTGEKTILNVGRFQLNNTVSDLKALQDQYRPFLGALAKQGINVTAGQLYTNVAGSYDGGSSTVKIDQPLELSTPGLTVTETDENGTRTLLNKEKLHLSLAGVVSMPAGGMNANVSALTVESSSNLVTIKKAGDQPFVVQQKGDAIAGNGTITLAADLKRLSDLGQSFSGGTRAAGTAGAAGAPSAPAAPAPANPAGQLRSGVLNTTIALTPQQGGAAQAKINGQITNLSITTADPKNRIDNETVAIDLTADSAADFSALTANGTVTSSFANTTLKDVKLALNGASIFDKLQNATIEIVAPSIPKLYNVMQAFSAPAPSPKEQTAAVAFAVDDPGRPSSRPSGGDVIGQRTPGTAGGASGGDVISVSPTRVGAGTQPSGSDVISGGSTGGEIGDGGTTGSGGADATPKHETQAQKRRAADARAAEERAAQDRATPAAAADRTPRNPEPAPDNKSAASAAAPPTTQPLQVTSGDAVVSLNVKRDASTTTVQLTNLQVNNLGLRRGDDAYQFAKGQPIKFALNAAIDSVADPNNKDQTLTEQVRKVTVTQLTGDVPKILALSMPQQLVVTNLATTPAASGAIAGQGSIDELTKFLAAAAGSKLPYRGDYSFSQTLQNQAAKLTVVGDLIAKQFRVLDASNKEIFTEPQVTIHNDLAADTQQKNATINALSVDMPQSKAVAVKLNGAVSDWAKQRKLDLKMDLAYDLAKLWPIVHPMLVTPGQEDTYADMKIAGAYQKQFTVGGSYPADLPATDKAIKHVTLNGELAVQSMEHMGLVIQNLVVPLTMAQGKAATIYGGRSDKDKLAPPAQCNNGTLNLGGIYVDVGGDTMRVTTVKGHKLLQNVVLNEVVTQSLGKSIGPMFANAKNAAGRLSVTIDQCDNVALGDKLKSPDSGTAHVTFSLDEMEIANPMGEELLGAMKLDAIPGVNVATIGSASNVFRGQIKGGVIELNKGVITEDITFAVADPNAKPELVHGKKAGAGSSVAGVPLYPFRFSGNVNLASQTQHLTADVPGQLIATWVRDEKAKQVISQVFGQGVPVTFAGTPAKSQIMLDPKFNDRLLQGFVTAGAGQLLGNIGGANKNNARDGGSSSSGNAVQDIVGGLLGGNKDGKNNETKSDETKHSSPPTTSGSGEDEPAKKKKKKPQ